MSRAGRIEVTAVATARISQQFEDGSAFEVEIEVDESYPDAVAEAKAQVLGLWREAFTAGEDGQ